ncbi:MAG: lysophospholipid acyltransferase family protein [Acidimicrobiia bacterium]
MRWTDPGFPQPGRALWRPLWPLARALAAAGWSLRVEGAAHVPRKGSLVVAANHFSHLDPPLVGVAVRRPVRFLALDELFGLNRFFDAVLLGLGAIPVPRGTKVPIRAMRVALAHLGQGGAVGVFPEARRVDRWGATEPRQGAAWLSLRSGAPLLPVAVSGTDLSFGLGSKRLRRSRVRIVLGRPLNPEDFRASGRAAMTRTWQEWVEERLSAQR